MSFREVQDNEWHQYANLAAYLNGRGVPNIDDAMKEIFLQPIHQAYRELVNPGYFRWIISNRLGAGKELGVHLPLKNTIEEVLKEAEDKSIHLLNEVSQIIHASGDAVSIAESIKLCLSAGMVLPAFQDKYPLPNARKYQAALKYLHAGSLKTSPWRNVDTNAWSVLLGWLFTSTFGRMVSDSGYEEVSRSWIDEGRLK